MHCVLADRQTVSEGGLEGGAKMALNESSRPTTD